MIYYSAYTEECFKDAQKYGLEEELDNIVMKIEEHQTSKFLEKFKSPAVVKRAGSYRFIGFEKIFGNVVFILFLKIMLKGRSEYDKFCINSLDYCKRILPKDDYILSKISEKENAGIKEKKKPDEIELNYLFTPISDDFEGSLMVCESNEFIQSIRKSEYKTQVSELIREIVESKSNISSNEKRHSNYTNLQLYFSFQPNLNILFLFQVITPNSKLTFDPVQFETVCSKLNSEEDILKLSRRTYPEYVLYDNDLWLEIQNETEGNLALSTEEAQIFNSLIHNKYEEPLFPLFINGRAGSGKSTLLYYTFSHILLNHILQDVKLSKPPIFLTYSAKLLDTAKRSIKKILKTNVKIRINLPLNGVDSVDRYLDSNEFDKSFKTFREFQKELLSPNDLDQFKESSYYRFSNFKEDWKKFSHRNPHADIRGITAEFAWYVIRTFIKGMRSEKDEFLDGEDYSHLPREMRTVSIDTYKNIYFNVFNNWYKKLFDEKKYWDDQDLTRCVLNSIENIDLNYPAVFCDEAQDFSVIELEFISELPIFTKRKLEFRDIKRIPLAFAGDPLQTINPTGFKWETIKAYFYEKLQSDFLHDGKIPINFKELNNNYRSSKAIVTFNNIVQLIRAILFNIKDISPQISWFVLDDNIPPTLKIDDYSVIEDALKEEDKTRTIIIPCEEDQEKEFIINRDSFLKEKAIIDGDVAQNIWSPMNVKGLEFNTVIVYKFGEYLAETLEVNVKDLVEELIKSDSLLNDQLGTKSIELEYFLNKLYVSTSSAKKNLVIVDSNIGNKYLWSIFNEYLKDLPIKYSIAINDRINWDIDNEISEFQFTDQVVNLAKDVPEDLANQFYIAGIHSSSARKLKTAASYFKAAQKLTEANRALAKAYELEENYTKAAEYYQKIQDGDMAIQCLWRLKDVNKFNKIIEVYKVSPRNPNNIFYLASKFMLSDQKKNESLLFLRKLSRLIRDNENIDFYMITDSTWDIVYNTLMKALVVYSTEAASLSDWDEAISILNILSKKGISLRKGKEYIELLFNLKRYKDVIEELTDTNDLDNILYIKAKAITIQYPENLEHSYKLKDYKSIIDQYRAFPNKNNELNNNHLEIILKSFIESNEPQYLAEFINTHSNVIDDLLTERIIDKIINVSYENKLYSVGFSLVDVFKDRKDDELYVNILRKILTKNNGELITYVLCLFLAQEVSYDKFHTVVDILENQRFVFDFIPKELINKASLEKVLLYRLAVKTKYGASNKEMKRMQTYVREMLVDDNRWITLCPLPVASAAIERLDWHINARDFYEKIFKGNLFTEEDKDFARRRWLKVKEKQAKDNQNDTIKQQILEDVKKWYIKWNYEYDFEIKDLEDYPLVSDKLTISLHEAYMLKSKTEAKSKKVHPSSISEQSLSNLDEVHTIETKNIEIMTTIDDAAISEQPLSSLEEISTYETKYARKPKTVDFKCSCFIEGMEIFLIKSLLNRGLIKIDNVNLGETIYYDFANETVDSREVDITIKNSDDNIREYYIDNWELIMCVEETSESHYLSFYYQDTDNEILRVPVFQS